MNTLYCLPDGTVQGLYTEAIDLATLGTLVVQRATSVEFDDEAQAWCAFSAMGQCLYSHPSRQECLRWEQQYFNQQREP